MDTEIRILHNCKMSQNVTLPLIIFNMLEIDKPFLVSCTTPGGVSRFGLWVIVCQPHSRALTETGDLCLKNINRALHPLPHPSFSSLQKSLGPGHSSFGFNIPFPFSSSPGCLCLLWSQSTLKAHTSTVPQNHYSLTLCSNPVQIRPNWTSWHLSCSFLPLGIITQ